MLSGSGNPINMPLTSELISGLPISLWLPRSEVQGCRISATFQLWRPLSLHTALQKGALSNKHPFSGRYQPQEVGELLQGGSVGR